MRPFHRVARMPWWVLVVACEGAPTETPLGPRLDLYEPHACPDGTAPLRNAQGQPVCLPVGASTVVSEGDFPSTEGATQPFVYVRAGAVGGDGSLASPYGDPSVAVASETPPGTVLVARGRYTLRTSLILSRSVEIRGMGSGGTIFEAPREGGVIVPASSAGSVRVTLSRLEIRSGAELSAIGVEASGMGVEVTLRDVAIRGVSVGVGADNGATLQAERLSIEDTARRGGEFTAGSVVVLRDARIVRGMGDGLWADRARLDLARVVISDHVRDGLVLLGSLVEEGSCAEDLPCTGLPAAPARACLSGRLVGLHELVDVSLLRNGVTGMRAQASDGGGAAAFVRATRLFVADTRVPAGTVGGDGLYVADGARVCLDPDIADDERRGRGSAFLRNARAGILADGGSPTPSARRGTRFDAAGALLGSNRGPGVFVQNGALADRVAFTTASDNVAIGVGSARGGRLALLLCDQMIYTRSGELVTSGAPLALGDGLTLADADADAAPTTLTDSELSHNDRFGLVAHQAAVTATGARGEGNGFGVGAYGGARIEGTPVVVGREASPTIAAAFRGALPTR